MSIFLYIGVLGALVNLSFGGFLPVSVTPGLDRDEIIRSILSEVSEMRQRIDTLEESERELKHLLETTTTKFTKEIHDLRQEVSQYREMLNNGNEALYLKNLTRAESSAVIQRKVKERAGVVSKNARTKSLKTSRGKQIAVLFCLRSKMNLSHLRLA